MTEAQMLTILGAIEQLTRQSAELKDMLLDLSADFSDMQGRIDGLQDSLEDE